MTATDDVLRGLITIAAVRTVIATIPKKKKKKKKKVKKRRK